MDYEVRELGQYLKPASFQNALRENANYSVRYKKGFLFEIKLLYKQRIRITP